MPFEKITEQESFHANLEAMSVNELLSAMNAEDKKVALQVEKVIPHIEQLVVEMVKRIKMGGRVFYVGAGTSGRLGVLDASELPPTFGIPQDLFIGIIAGGDGALQHSVERAEDDQMAAWDTLLTHGVNEQDVVIGIAASGTTPYVIGVLKQAQANGILTACITCNPHSPVAYHSDHKIELVVGPEFITGSTRLKAGTAQKMVLNMISNATMIQLGRVRGSRMVNMKLVNAKLIDRGTRILMNELNMDYEAAKQLLLKAGSVRDALGC
jgi:N-acetylmuramic acid 6-phosphate etherase